MKRAFVLVVCIAGCASSPTTLDGSSSSDSGAPQDDAFVAHGGGPIDAWGTDAHVISDARAAADVGRDAGAPCTTRVTYGSRWIRPSGHSSDYDDVSGVVSWDGTCVDDGANSYALLDNGWRPYFSGHSACVIAFDRSGDCSPAPGACATRIAYGTDWLRAPMHPNDYDDVSGVVTWGGDCSGGATQLSNGWAPRFSGACSMSFRYDQCGGLYANPVIGFDCPDPGVTNDGTQYVLTCTSGNAAAAFPIFTSPDLVHWSARGHVFPAGTRPAWASGDFWAPEIHHVGARWMAYFSARESATGRLAVGAAHASSALGPFTDIGAPLVRGSPGVIDAHEITTSAGQHFVVYKNDGNSIGARTPIFAQEVQADGVTFIGGATQLITNDRAWEGGVVEGPWMIEDAGTFYLFYSANGYASPSYAIGVARASSPLGPFTKAAAPILTTSAAWAGPGHGSVVRAPGGEWAQVYHAWEAGHVGGAPGRLVLVDRVAISGGWPTMISAPTEPSQPPP